MTSDINEILTNYIYTVLKRLDPKMTYKEIDTVRDASLQAIQENEELHEDIKSLLRDVIVSTYYKTIDKIRHTKLDYPEKGDITIYYRDDHKISLRKSNVHDSGYVMLYKDHDFNAYWAKKLMPDHTEEVIEKLYYFLKNLPSKFYIYPYLSIWAPQQEWEKYFTQANLDKLERILEDDYEVYDDVTPQDFEVIKYYFDNRLPLDRFVEKWPQKIKEVISFEEKSKDEDSLTGIFTYLQNNGETMSILIEASKLMDYYTKEYEWDIHHWQAITKSFPRLVESDNKLLQDYLLERYPV